MMEVEFWHRRWENNEIAFHENETNPLLVNFFSSLPLVKGDSILLPLCGKTLDIAWFLSKGINVVGAELSKLAIEQLFDDIKITPKISSLGNLEHYSATNIDIFVGNFFHLSKQNIGKIHAVYDRAALVALPESMRIEYTTKIMELTELAPQLLICYEYNQSLIEGPPFSISDEELFQHYSSHYKLNLLYNEDVKGGLRKKTPAIEKVWLLEKK